jgi:glycosyltransferase involved in cell wall biosynthesis
MEGVSVIICCFNSVKVLPPTLAHLAGQQLDKCLAWEIILVDNASTDGTANFALSEWEKHEVEVPFTVVAEPRAGLIHARIKGANEAKYNYLVFCDDDNWLSNDYIETAFNIMTSNDLIGACGGLGTPVFETGQKPGWLTNFILAGYAIGPQSGTGDGLITDRYHIYGAGMTIRKAILNEIYQEFFHSNFLLSGRSGETLAAGDDSAISFFVLLKGYQLWYSSKLKFTHYLTQKRLTKEYAMRMYGGFGRAAAHLRIYYLFLPPSSSIKKQIYKYWLGRVFRTVFIGTKILLSVGGKNDKPFLFQVEYYGLKESLTNIRELKGKLRFLLKHY